jgi:hypothetical protein
MQIADGAGVTKHNVIRTEQAMSVTPPPTLLNYFCDTFPVSRIEMINQYEKFQIKQRSLRPNILSPDESLSDLLAEYRVCLSRYNAGHPFVWLRQLAGYNPTSIAKALCINQTVVVYFESNPVKQQTVPEQLRNALKDNGYTNRELDLLDQAYQAYRNFLLGRQNVKVEIPA